MIDLMEDNKEVSDKAFKKTTKGKLFCRYWV